MAEAILRLIKTADGTQQLVIDHKSDSDALPHEHEEEHRQVADKVIEGGMKGHKGLSVSRDNDGRQRQAEKPHEVPAEKQTVKA